MPLDLIIGAQWGDEGKGRITDRLARQAEVVARFSGGDNAGHSVTVEDQLFRLHLVPSGIVQPHTVCVMGSGMVINPAELINEIERLRQAGIEISPNRLIIDHRAHLITPGHLALDGAEEVARGQAKLGTTKRGIGPAYTDRTARRGLPMGLMRSPDRLKSELQHHLERVNRLLETFFQIDGIEVKPAIEDYLGYADRLLPYLGDGSQRIDNALREDKRVLAEGAQGTLLDLDYGTYPYVTSSHPTTAGALLGLGVGPGYLGRVIGVAKAFQTRVGEGPFPTEIDGPVADHLRGTGAQPWDEYGTTTGRPRRCGWLDLVLLRYAQRINGFTEIALTKLDILSNLPELKVCTAYSTSGQTLGVIDAELALLAASEAVLETRQTWTQDLSAHRAWEQLPEPTRDYVKSIEGELGIPVPLISIGPERDQIIER
jgi:adenylosuccinate synthase